MQKKMGFASYQYLNINMVNRFLWYLSSLSFVINWRRSWKLRTSFPPIPLFLPICRVTVPLSRMNRQQDFSLKWSVSAFLPFSYIESSFFWLKLLGPLWGPVIGRDFGKYLPAQPIEKGLLGGNYSCAEWLECNKPGVMYIARGKKWPADRRTLLHR